VERAGVDFVDDALGGAFLGLLRSFAMNEPSTEVNIAA
jgi:hypothetical protein